MNKISIVLSLLMSACAASAPPADPQFILLGEVHDNAVQHQARAAYLRALLADGKPTTVVFEQMGRAQDLALAAAPREAQALVEAGKLDQTGWRWPLHKPIVDAVLAGGATVQGGKLDQTGWRWPLHKPIVDAALAGGARLQGGNLERDEVRRVVREGAAALPPDLAGLMARTPWSAAQQQALVKVIDEGHCGALPASLHAGMALAQRARDAALAQAMLNARGAGAERVVLIAGNGHVRRDLAVPLYLQAAGVPAQDILSRAYLEPDGEAGPYDQVQRTPAAAREDPCQSLTKNPPKASP